MQEAENADAIRKQKDELRTAGSSDVEESEEKRRYDRENLLKVIMEGVRQKSRIDSRNQHLQTLLYQYFQKKKPEEQRDSDRSVADQEQRYVSCIATLEDLRKEYTNLSNHNKKTIEELRGRLDKKKGKAGKVADDFNAYKRSVADDAENSRTGKPIPPKVIEQIEINTQKKDVEVMAVRLDYIKLRNKLKRHEQLLRQKVLIGDKEFLKGV